LLDCGQRRQVPDPEAGQDIEGGVVGSSLEPAKPENGLFSPWAGHGMFVVGLIKCEAPMATVHAEAGLSETTGGVDILGRGQADHQVHRDHRIDILNLSLGVTTKDDEPPLVLRRAIDRLPDDVLVVAAAGNRAGTAGVSAVWPAALTDVAASVRTPSSSRTSAPQTLGRLHCGRRRCSQ